MRWRWPPSNVPGDALGMFLILGVVAVGALSWVDVTDSRRQSDERQSAQTQTQRISDPILNLCKQGDTTAVKLRGAGVCATAREVKNGTPPAPVTTAQIQAMLDQAINSLNHRHDPLPPLPPVVLLPVPIEVAPRAPAGSITESHRIRPGPPAAPPRTTAPRPSPSYPPATPAPYPSYGAPPVYQQPAQPPVQQPSSGLLGNLLNPGRSLFGIN